MQESLFQDDDLLLHASPAEVDHTMAELKDIGVDRVRLSAIWKDIVPVHGVPDENLLGYMDTAIQTANRYGIGVLINVRGPAPEWAQHHPIPEKMIGRSAYRPNAAMFAEFVSLLGDRYNGAHGFPRVNAWSIWNEPNWGGHLQPQTVRDSKTHRLRTVAPVIYRRLLRAANGALAATGHGTDTVLLGETAPIGNPKLGELSHLKPLRFYRDLFCLDHRLRPLRGVRRRELQCDFKKNGPLRADAIGHHPYSVVQPPWQPTPDRDDVTLADLPRLYQVINAAARAKRIHGHLPVWLTEFGYQTSPPDPYRGVTLDQQAAWLIAAEHQTWADRRVAAFTQFLLRDAAPFTVYPASDPRFWGSYQTGLKFSDGTPKPAYDSYRLPLLAPDGLRPGRPLSLWGMVRPGANGQSQQVRIEFRPGDGAGWSTLQDIAVTTQRGYFETTVPSAQAGQYRFEWIRPQPPGGRSDPREPLPSAPLGLR